MRITELFVYLVQQVSFGIGIVLLLEGIEKPEELLARHRIGQLLIIMVYPILSVILGTMVSSLIATITILLFVAIVDKKVNGGSIMVSITNSLASYTLNILSVILSSVIAYSIFFVIGKSESWSYMMCAVILFYISIITVLYLMLRKFDINHLIHGKYVRCGLDILCIIIIFATKGFNQLEELDTNTISALFLFVMLISIVIAFIWFRDKIDQMRREAEMKQHEAEMRKHEEEMEKREEEMKISNRDLSGIVHKSREIFPSIAIRLKYLEDHAGESKELADELQKLREDVEVLSREQAEEDRVNNLFHKTFNPSGIGVVDGILQNKLNEAANVGIDFDIIIRQPMNGLPQGHHISNLALSRLIGDLLNNAIYALENTEREDKSLFFCGGLLNEDVYEIALHDNADPFPAEVLRNLGERGNTSHPDAGGTGNGMPDILETVELAEASFCLEEYSPDEGLFTKSISIRFDGLNRRVIKTDRKEELGRIDQFFIL